jgi:hypothetical protein
MPTKKTKEKETKKEKPPKAITFKCQRCNQYKPIEDMRVIRRFFPMPVVCRECEKGIR